MRWKLKTKNYFHDAILFIMNDLQTNLANICRRYGITTLYAFGSRAAEVRELLNTEREELEATSSDLDIAVLPDADTLPAKYCIAG